MTQITPNIQLSFILQLSRFCKTATEKRFVFVVPARRIDP